MKRGKPRWIRWGVVLLVLGLPWLFLLKPYSHYRCGICGSWRDESQYRVGPSRDWSIPLSPVIGGVRPTLAAEKLLGPGHTHQWSFSQGSDGYVFIRWGMICGLGRRAQENPFVREWEEGTTFRAFVDGERRGGRLSQDDVVAIAELPRWPSAEQAQDPKVVKAFNRAQQLFRDSGLRDTGAGWSDWSLPESAPAGCPGPPK